MIKIGSLLLAAVAAAGLGLTLIYLLWALRWGRPAPNNLWGSRGFEWDTATPPTAHNFEGPLDYTGRIPHDYWNGIPPRDGAPWP